MEPETRNRIINVLDTLLAGLMIAIIVVPMVLWVVNFAFSDYYVELRSPYYFFRTKGKAKFIRAMKPEEGFEPALPYDIVEFNYDDTFIIAKQDWDRIKYWIIDSKKKIQYGPLTYEDFEATRKTIGVPQELELKHFSTFGPKLRDEKFVENALDSCHEKICELNNLK